MLSKMEYGQHFWKYPKDKAFFYSKCSFIVIGKKNKEFGTEFAKIAL